VRGQCSWTRAGVEHQEEAKMARTIRVAECVRLPDGRIGRVRSLTGDWVLVRVRRKTSQTHQLLRLPARKLRRIGCPGGWMSPQGYARYLRVTLAKLRERRASKRRPR
jgi:hypothetical protein